MEKFHAICLTAFAFSANMGFMFRLSYHVVIGTNRRFAFLVSGQFILAIISYRQGVGERSSSQAVLPCLRRFHRRNRYIRKNHNNAIIQ